MIYGFSMRVPVVGVAVSVAICRLSEADAARIAVEEEAARELRSDLERGAGAAKDARARSNTRREA